MSYFNTTEDVKIAIGGLIDRCSTNGEVGPKIRGYDMVIKFSFHNPEYTLIIDGRKNVNEASYYGVREGSLEDKEEVDIELEMDSDVAHRLFLGKLSITKALMSNLIKYKGNIRPLMRLSSVLSTMQNIYSRHLEQIEMKKAP